MGRISLFIMKFTSLSFIFLLLSFINIKSKSKPDPKTLLVETKDEGGDFSNDYHNYEGDDYNDESQLFWPRRDYLVGPSIPPEHRSTQNATTTTPCPGKLPDKVKDIYRRVG